MEFLLQWGGELILSIIAAGIIAYFKGESNKLKKKLEAYETMTQAQADAATE